MFNRRSVLKGALAAPVLLLASRPGRSRADTFTTDYGVASGDPRPDSVVLWTRVPEAFQPEGSSVTVNFEVATSQTFESGSYVLGGIIVIDAETDYTVKVTVRNLAPATRYYYRFWTDTGYKSVTGRTQTAPAAGSSPEAIRFAYVSCQDYTQGFYTVYASLAEEDLDFCVHLGDNIYETGAAGFQEGQVREDTIGGGEADELSEYRQKYQLYLSDVNLREVRRLFPWVFLWDDHELFNNYAGTETSVEVPQRQRDAYRVFLEYMPVLPVVPLSATDPPTVQLYRQFAFGNLLEVFVLDERQYRDGVVCRRDFATLACPQLDDPERTMLGQEQKDWLKSNLESSPARWKVLLNEVMMMRFEAINLDPRAKGRNLPPAIFESPLLVDQGLYINLDAWDGYPAERTELLEFVADRQIRNVVVATGDIHNCYAGVLRPNFSDLDSPAVAVEIVGGSVSSAGLYELLGDVDLTELGSRILMRANPHIEYVDLRYHVYTRFTVTPEHLTATYVAVNTIAQTTSESFVLQEFTIPNGEARLVQS